MPTFLVRKLWSSISRAEKVGDGDTASGGALVRPQRTKHYPWGEISCRSSAWQRQIRRCGSSIGYSKNIGAFGIGHDKTNVKENEGANKRDNYTRKREIKHTSADACTGRHGRYDKKFCTSLIDWKLGHEIPVNKVISSKYLLWDENTDDVISAEYLVLMVNSTSRFWILAY